MFENFYSNRKVFVTGHTGFKGSWLSLWLIHLGARVVGYALEPPSEPNLFSSLNLHEKLSHCPGDIRDEKRLAEVLHNYNPQIVIHMAAQSLVRRSYEEPRLTYETNVMGTVNLFEAVRRTESVRVVINVTSDKCYENKEWVYGYRETDPMGGRDPYSSSKGCAELVTSAYARSYFSLESHGQNHNVSLASARAGNVIGGGDWASDRIVPDCIRALLRNETIVIRNPHAIRPWQHVLEPLSGYLLLARKLYEHPLRYAGGWNFGPDDDYPPRSVAWLVDRLCAKWSGKASYATDNGEHHHEAHQLRLDCSRAKAELGWRPRWKIEKALDSIVEWTKRYEGGENMSEVCLKQIEGYSDTLIEE